MKRIDRYCESSMWGLSFVLNEEEVFLLDPSGLTSARLAKYETKWTCHGKLPPGDSDRRVATK